jgi:hypothetical protein
MNLRRLKVLCIEILLEIRMSDPRFVGSNRFGSSAFLAASGFSGFRLGRASNGGGDGAKPWHQSLELGQA